MCNNCRCGGKCEPIKVEPENNGGVMDALSCLMILLVLAHAPHKPIESGEDMRELIDGAHKRLLEMADEMDKKVQEMKKEGAWDEV